MTGFGFVGQTENDDYVAKKFFSLPKTKRSLSIWGWPWVCCECLYFVVVSILFHLYVVAFQQRALNQWTRTWNIKIPNTN